MRRALSLAVLTCLAVLVSPLPLRAGGWLGVTIEQPRGVQIGEIIKGGPADQAGLVNGDIILSVNRTEIQSTPHFLHEIAQLSPQEQIVLNVIRQGKNMEVNVVLEDSNDHRSVSQSPFFHGPLATYQRGSVLTTTPSPYPDYASPSSDYLPPASPAVVPSAWLGIAPDRAKEGVLVRGIAPNGPGEQAGLQGGDIIVSINGQAVSSPVALVRLMTQFKPDDVVELSLIRAGQPKTVQVKVAPNPAKP